MRPIDPALYPFKSHFFDRGAGLRMHYLDEGGDAPPVLMLHGNPSWSFHYRNLVRVLAGPSHGRLLALSAATGALILIWADVLARTLLSSGQELPVGVVSALLGGPFFFYLLKSRRSRGMW